MSDVMNNWKHIFKLDPAKEIADEKVDQLCQSGTDAIIVGGTDNVTLNGVLRLQSILKQHQLPTILEISSMDAITLGFDYYFIPMVMNSQETKWMIDIQHEAIKKYKQFMDWSQIFIEGYCILNEDSKAFVQTNCKAPSVEDVIAYAHMAEHMFKLPIFYVEYSGAYGDPFVVEQAKHQLHDTLLFYGGGIETSDQAIEMKKHADVVIVGNSIYTDFKQALHTVQAVKQVD